MEKPLRQSQASKRQMPQAACLLWNGRLEEIIHSFLVWSLSVDFERQMNGLLLSRWLLQCHWLTFEHFFHPFLKLSTAPRMSGHPETDWGQQRKKAHSVDSDSFWTNFKVWKIISLHQNQWDSDCRRRSVCVCCLWALHRGPAPLM